MWHLKCEEVIQIKEQMNSRYSMKDLDGILWRTTRKTFLNHLLSMLLKAYHRAGVCEEFKICCLFLIFL